MGRRRARWLQGRPCLSALAPQASLARQGLAPHRKPPNVLNHGSGAASSPPAGLLRPVSALPPATCWCPCLLEGPQARLGESGLPRSRGPHHGAYSSEPPGARGSFPPFPAANGQEIHQHDAGLIQKPPADITFNGEMLTFAPKTEMEARVSPSTT